MDKDTTYNKIINEMKKQCYTTDECITYYEFTECCNTVGVNYSLIDMDDFMKYSGFQIA